jgi:tetratricopeptide (TPR) repeat protein
VFDIRPSRPNLAAIQLHAGGGGTIVGLDDDDEPSMASAIALDEASSSGIDEIPELPSGAFGLLQMEPPERPAAPTPAPEKPRPPGAPTLTAKQVEALVGQAEAAARRNVHEAVLLYSDVLDAQPNHPRALTARGRLYLDLGDFPRAISDLLRATERDPSDVLAHAGIGDFWFARKDYRRAISACDAAMVIAPDNADILYRRGMSRYYSRDFGPAVEDMERARKIDPRLPSIDTYLDRARRKQV